MTTTKRTLLTALTTAALLLAPAHATPAGTDPSPTKAPDMSNGADNFYKSDKVTLQKVTFKNKLNMNVVGNQRDQRQSSHHHRRVVRHR
jgi:hypothetical protein